MRIIPRNTKVSTEFFKGVSLTDMAVGAFGVLLVFFLVLSSLPHKVAIIGGVFFVFVLLLVRIDEEPNYMFIMRILKHLSYNRHYKKRPPKALSEESDDDGEVHSGKGKKEPKKKIINFFMKKEKSGGAKEEHEQETEESLTETE